MTKGDIVYVKRDYPVQSFAGCRVKIRKFNKSRCSAPSTFTVEVLEYQTPNKETFSISDLTKNPT